LEIVGYRVTNLYLNSFKIVKKSKISSLRVSGPVKISLNSLNKFLA